MGEIDLEVAAHVLWHFGDVLGWEPGTFTKRLMLTISAADSGNREKLAAGFPEYVAAFVAVQEQPWGLEWLRSKVKRGLVPDRERPVDLFEGAAAEAGS